MDAMMYASNVCSTNCPDNPHPCATLKQSVYGTILRKIACLNVFVHSIIRLLSFYRSSTSIDDSTNIQRSINTCEHAHVPCHHSAYSITYTVIIDPHRCMRIICVRLLSRVASHHATLNLPFVDSLPTLPTVDPPVS
mmetsp:Transcript_9837/g.26847  ORF Transcript_9837/g.26847 Transcript_9837/m.26847 type:complete len:137 (-) Transcript_9837:427-837(-)